MAIDAGDVSDALGAGIDAGERGRRPNPLPS